MKHFLNYWKQSLIRCFWLNQLTQKQEQQQIDALHLLFALLKQEESIVLVLLQRLGVDTEDLGKKIERSIEKIPPIISPKTFGQLYLTQDMAQVLEKAGKEAMKMGDEFISVEHLFLALLKVNTKAKQILDNATFLKSQIGEKLS